jgi:hypothetical protein
MFGCLTDRLFHVRPAIASLRVGITVAPTLFVWLRERFSAWISKLIYSLLIVNPNTSQTISTVGAGAFDITYLDRDYAKGDYIKDLFAVGTTYQSHMILEMGLATNTTPAMAAAGGIMGIGYPSLEDTSVQYPNFMDQMVGNKLTNTKIYSLWLNDQGSSTGSILFGGIDTEKYFGTLYSMPVHQDSLGNYSQFNVGLTSVTVTPGVGFSIPITNASFSATVEFVSSTYGIFLPDDAVDIIYSQFNATVNNGTAYVDCKSGNSSYMSFGFETGAVINVAYSEFINKIGVPNPLPTGLPFSDVCIIGIYKGIPHSDR